MVKYNSYKDSGVEWMKQIPNSWLLSRVRFVGDLYGGLTGKKGDDFNNDENPKNKPFIPFTNIFNNTYISKDHFQYVNIEEGEKQNRVLSNDLFFLMSSETYEDLGKCSILLDEVDELYLNSFCKGYRIKDKRIFPLFLNYQLLGSLHKEMISIEGNGFTRINLRQDRLLDIPVFIPPIQEQNQIVEFLDTKTTLIDTLIEKTQQKIQLLKEQRTSLINHVVTKGLNPNVELKDSGVDWIREIPSCWFRKKLKHLFNYKKGYPFKSENMVDNGIPIIKVTDIKNLTIKDPKDYFNESLDNRITEVHTNDIIITTVGSKMEVSNSSVGQLGFVTEKQNGFLLNQNTICLTKKSNSIIESFIFYLLQSNYFRGHLDIYSHGTVNQSSLNVVDILDFISIYPPTSEQQQIVEFLDKKTNLIDTTISREEKRIELLKEYRQSLISNVVTGKIKVCD